MLYLIVLLKLSLFSNSAFAATLSERVAEIDKSAQYKDGTYYNKCDEKQAPIRKELAELLDQKSSQIIDLIKTTTQKNSRRIQIGPAFFRELTDRSPYKPGYHEEFFKWEDLYKVFQTIKDNPNDPKWIKFNFGVKYLIGLDENRKVWRDANFYRGAEKDYNNLINSITNCLANSKCDKLSENENLNPLSVKAYNMGTINSFFDNLNYSYNKRRDWFEFFLDIIKDDFKWRYDFQFNESIYRENATEIVLPIDPGPFKGYEALLAPYIEGPWSSEKLSIKIKWTTQAENPKAYIIIYNENPGAVSFVSWKKREIHLTINSFVSTFAHEFGHVLGFADRYYYHWDEKECAYLDQYDSDDVMSDDLFGKVVPKDFEVLNRQYPEKN